MTTRMVIRVDKDGTMTLGGVLGMLLNAVSAGAPTDAAMSIVRHRSGGIAEIAVDWPPTSEARSPEIGKASQNLAALLTAPATPAKAPRSSAPPPPSPSSPPAPPAASDGKVAAKVPTP